FKAILYIFRISFQIWPTLNRRFRIFGELTMDDNVVNSAILFLGSISEQYLSINICRQSMSVSFLLMWLSVLMISWFDGVVEDISHVVNVLDQGACLILLFFYLFCFILIMNFDF